MKIKKNIAKMLQNLAETGTKNSVNRSWFPGIHELEPSDQVIRWVHKCKIEGKQRK